MFPSAFHRVYTIVVEKAMQMTRDFKGLLRYRWLVYLLITSVYFFVYFHRVSPAVMGHEFAREWSLSGTSLGIMSSLYFYLYAVAQIPAGILADFIGPKKLIIFSAASMTLGSFLSYIAPTFTMLAAGRALIGLGAGFTLIPLAKILLYWFRKGEFATMIGLNISIGNVGAIFASAPLMALITLVGWRNAFLYISVITLTLAIMNVRCVKDTPEEMGFPPIEQDKTKLNRIKQTSIQMTIKNGVHEWFCNRTFPLITIIATISYGTLISFVGLWVGPFLADVYKMSNAEIGNWLLTIAIGMVIGYVSAGYLSDKVFKGRRKILIITGSVFYALNWALLLIVISSQQYLLFLRFLFFTFAITNSIASVPIMALIRDLAPKESYGTIMGICNTITFIGGAFFQIITGNILDRSTPIIENGIKVFSMKGYLSAFIPSTIGAFLCVALALLIKEN